MNIDFLSEVLHEAGKMLMTGFGPATRITTKENQSNVVTESDFKSEEIIRQMISSKYPMHNLLGEEHGFEDKKSPYTWIIDPLDGTSNFAAHIPWFGVLIALMEKELPVLAGAYLPVSDEIYIAESGNGVTKNGVAIRVTEERNLKNLLCCYAMDFSEDISKAEQELQIVRSLVQNCRNIRSTNSLLDFCMVADGRLGAALNQTMKIWDIAAPQLIIEEAGGKITDIQGNKIKYDLSVNVLTQNFTAIAASPAVHTKILNLIREIQ